MSEYEVSIRLTNSREIPVPFVVEPWGQIYEMQPSTTFTLILRSPRATTSDHPLEVEYGSDHLTVYAWEGCTVSLFHEGEELGMAGAPPVPLGMETLKGIGFFRGSMQAVLAEMKQQDEDSREE